MTANESTLLSLLAASVHQRPPPSPAAGTDWLTVLVLARKHSVSNLAYDGLARLPLDQQPEPQVRRQFEEDAQLMLTKDAHQQYETERIFAELERAGIDYMPLKGWIFKAFYPRPDLRTMGDVDILYEASQTKAVRRIMRNLGFEEHLNPGNEDVYKKPPYLIVEMHRSILPKSDPHFNEFNILATRGVRDPGNPNRLTLAPRDLYLLHLGHLEKHFRGAGSGIRSILDDQVFRDYFKMELNWSEVDQELERIGLLRLAQRIKSLGDAWFGSETPLDAGISDELELLSAFFLGSGTYGNQKGHVLSMMLSDPVNNTDDTSIPSLSRRKIRHVLHRLFPGANFLAGRYPILELHPILLPIFWFVRLISSIFQRRRFILSEMKTVGRITNKELEKVRFIRK